MTDNHTLASMRYDDAPPSPATDAAPAFYIGQTPVYGRWVLAPLSGYNDQPFRRLCRRLGASLVYTGLLAANAIYFGASPEGDSRTAEMLQLHPEEAPVAVQLFSGRPAALVMAAQAIEHMGMAMIDINMGCAKAKIVKSGAGAALMWDPRKVARIFAKLSRTVSVPVSGKIRLGWDQDRRNYLEVARAMADHGAALVAVHGRTAEQRFNGDADWDAIAEVKQAVTIPVLASGDVTTVSAAHQLLARTGCDGVMIGRAAIGNPWLFAGRHRDDIPWPERLALVQKHLEMTVAHHGEHHGIRRFRKHLRGYLRASGIPRPERIRMLGCRESEELVAMLNSTGQ
ncbi:MAG: tRNA dihydrouridine synthase DusB [Anaerolineae bacterium]|nr:tRNA dihydrouridine synthase DusB [Anaerolineae bacterium]